MSQPPTFPFTDTNTWRVKTAHNLALIIDAADYFRVLRKVFLETERELLLIGWDFDFELDMLPGESDEDGNAPDGFPNKLGPFLESVVEREPQLHVHILKWNGAFLVTPGRILPTLAMYFFGSERIHFAMDSHHPCGRATFSGPSAWRALLRLSGNDATRKNDHKEIHHDAPYFSTASVKKRDRPCVLLSRTPPSRTRR